MLSIHWACIAKRHFVWFARGADLKKALEESKQAVDQMKVLTDQMEAVKIAAVEEFKLLDAYDDNNMTYFFAGFELLRNNRKESILTLIFMSSNHMKTTIL